VWRRVGSATSMRPSEPWLEPLRDAYACIVVPLASRLAIWTQIVGGVECWSHPYSLQIFVPVHKSSQPKNRRHGPTMIESEVKHPSRCDQGESNGPDKADNRVGDIVIGEETDVDPDGSYASHLDLYSRAIGDVGARRPKDRSKAAGYQREARYRRRGIIYECCLPIGLFCSRRLGDWRCGFDCDDLANPTFGGSCQRHAESVGRRERLYGDFIDESSALFVDALTHGQLDPSKFVQIYATIGKLRLFASADFVSEADKAMKDISEIYYLPNRNFSKRENASETDLNILQAFSEACRNDLRE
jgi:hypothetical protein